MAAGDVTIGPVTAEDVRELVLHMRLDDKQECAALGLTPAEALSESLGRSTLAGAARVDGQLLAVFGLAPCGMPRATLLSRWPMAVAWCLTTDAVPLYPLAFWRTSRRVLAAMRAEACVLINIIDARYTASLRWVEALGARVAAARACWSPSGHPFHLVSFEGAA